MLWNSRRVWFLLWLVIAMVLAPARPALAQITEVVQMTDVANDFEYYDAVNKNGSSTTAACPTDGSIKNNFNSDPTNFARDQFCSTSIIRVGDKVEWVPAPPGNLAPQHGTESGPCTMGAVGTCTPVPNAVNPNWTFQSNNGQPTDSPFTVPPGSNAAYSFNAAGIFPYFCTVHTAAMTGTVVVQDYSVSISPAAQWVYVSGSANFNGTATAFPSGTMANGSSAAYSAQVGLSFNGANQPINVNNLPATAQPTTAGNGFSFTDAGESTVGDYDMQVLGTGLDASSLKHNSNDPILHVVQLTMGAVSPASLTIAPTDAVGKTATLQVTANGTFPSTVVPTCSITGNPAGVNCAFSPNPITPGGAGAPAQTLTMTITTNNAPSGTYSASVVINPGGGLAQKSSAFTLVIEDFTFTLSGSANQTVAPGGTATFTGMASPVGGYPGTVTFTCNPPAPGGAACPGAGSTSSPATLPVAWTVTATNYPLGTSNFSIVATGSVGPVVHSIPVTVNVGSFLINTPSTNTPSTTVGNPSSPMTFHVKANGAFFGTVALTCTGLPAGSTCQFFPSSSIALNGGGSDVTVTLTIDAGSNGANSYPFNVHGVAGASSQDLALTLNVVAGSGSADLQAFTDHNPTPDPVLSGSNMQFLLTARNNGPNTAGSVTVVFDADVPLHIVSVAPAPSANCPATSSLPVTCTFTSNVAVGGTANATITATAPFVRSFTATMQVSSSAADPTPNNNTATTTTQVRLRPFARKGLVPLLP